MMDTSTLSTFLVSLVTSHGAPMLALLLAVAALGLPLPSTLLVIISGAFIQQGVLDPVATIGLALVGVVAGDVLSYGIGRTLHGRMQRRFGQTVSWQRAEGWFAQRAALAIFLTRWLLTPIALPINLLAGGAAYPMKRFLAYDAAGELTWLAGYGMLGYLFGSQWERISTLVGSFSTPVIGVLLGGVALYLLAGRLRGAILRPATS